MVELDADVVVLDLDDTLYLEREFARSGFRALERHVQVAGFADHCLALLDSGRRGDIFNRALAHFRCEDDWPIADLVSIYRSHSPDIALARDADAFLHKVAGLTTALVSDGPHRTQAAKVTALGLSERIDRIVLTGALGEGFGKPHPRAFEEIMTWSDRPADRHVYIADNAAKDFVSPNRLGWQTIQILRPKRIHDNSPPSADHAAQAKIASFDDVVVINPAACDPKPAPAGAR
jgi:putative hydrolase of the HAD superfamily